MASYHTYIDAAGETVAEFTGRKLRTYPAGYGYTTSLEITDDPDTAQLGREVTRRLGLRGVAKLDFKRDDDGRLHLLEVNPRFNLWHHPGAVAGVNLPALVYADLAGNPRPAVARAHPGVRWCSVRHDLPAALRGGVDLRTWLRAVAHCDVKSGFSWNDPLPLARALIWRARGRVTHAKSLSRESVLPDGAPRFAGRRV
jgi:predicted ATP-grasp superfamily ATP-dependent carboligase